jgi:acyl-CoA reductase-like NAD-dependent aldehyde dehydrogenase
LNEKAVAAELKTMNPATEEIINRYEIMTREQINDKVKKARNTFQDWKKDVSKRAPIIISGDEVEAIELANDSGGKHLDSRP